jgi:hypothetical protein
LLLGAVDQACDLTEKVAACLREWRQAGKLKHTLEDLVRQRVYQIACGYPDGEDAEALRTDPILKLLVEREPESGADLASQPTISRFENGVGRQEVWAVSEVLIQDFIAHHREAPHCIILDVDTTEDKVHGEQEGRAFHGYYGGYCYVPLFVFARCDNGPEQELLVALLRAGDAGRGTGAVGVLKRVVGRLREAWPQVRFLVRGDSEFGLPEVLDWCEATEGVEYVVGMAGNERLEALAGVLRERATKAYAEQQRPVQYFTAVEYRARSWKQARHVIIKVERNEKGENIRYVVTSLKGRKPHRGWKIYAQRGDPENRIKEMKIDLESGRTSCSRFLANQFRLLLPVVAYVLLQRLRAAVEGAAEGLGAAPEWARAQAGTLREKLLKIGARVRERARKIQVQLATSYPYQALWQETLQRVQELRA